METWKVHQYFLFKCLCIKFRDINAFIGVKHKLNSYLGNLCCVFHGRATFVHPSLQVPKSFLQSCGNIHALASLKQFEAPNVVAPKHQRQKMEQLCQFPTQKNNATNIIHLVTSGHGLPTHSQQYWNVQLHGPQQPPVCMSTKKSASQTTYVQKHPKGIKRVPLADILISFQIIASVPCQLCPLLLSRSLLPLLQNCLISLDSLEPP